MDGEKVYKFSAAGIEKRLYITRHPPAHARAYLCPGIAFEYIFAAESYQFHVFGNARLRGAPKVDDIGLVPNFVILYPALKMLRQRPQEIPPCGLDLLSVIERDVPDRGGVRKVFHINRISKSDIKPRADSAAYEVVDDAVEPLEIVDPLLGLATVPARLASRPFYPRLFKFIVGLFRIEDFSVEAFKAYAQRRPSYIFRPGIFYSTDFDKGIRSFQGDIQQECKCKEGCRKFMFIIHTR